MCERAPKLARMKSQRTVVLVVPPKITISTLITCTARSHTLSLADGDALVEARLVVEVRGRLEDGALLLACVAVWTAEKKLPRADYCMYVGNNAPRSFYR